MKKPESILALNHYLRTTEKLGSATARDYVSRVWTFLVQNNLNPDELSWKEVMNEVKKYLQKAVKSRTEYSVRSALRALLRFANHIVSIRYKEMPHRDMIGFNQFLHRTYRKKRGNGKFLSTDQYESYINTFCKLRRMPEWKLHRLSKAEMVAQILNLKDSKLQVSHLNHIICASEAYYQYIRYTLGQYQSNGLKP